MNVDVRDYGASGEGGKLDTASIQAAIDSVAAAGGGMVVVSPGQYRVGTVFLLDNVRLHLDAGAVLVGSTDADDYTHRDFDGAGTEVQHDLWHLLVADGCRDIALTGQGRIDGSGPSFYFPPERELAWPRPFPENGRMRTMVEFHRCRGVVVEDVTLGNVSNWTLHLHESDDVVVRGIRIENPPTAPNADGIDITGCRNVRINGCRIDTCDDAICLKTNPRGRTCEDITVDGCVIRTHCVALKVGSSETYQDVRNVAFSNCVVRGSSRAIGLYSHQGCIVENISASNIVCDTCVPLMFTRPIHLECYNHERASGPSTMRNILIAGLLAETNGRCMVTAQPGCDLSDITLRDVQLRYPVLDDPAPRAAEAPCGQFSKGNPRARVERAALVAEGVRDLTVEGFLCKWPAGDTPDRWLFEKKMANGCHDLFEPADWTLAADCPFAAVCARNVNGGYIRGPVPDGFQGGEALRMDECNWAVIT